MKVHLNGSLLPAEQARVSPFDRGFIFGDGVYEGLRATRSHIVGMRLHQDRLAAGLREARIGGFDVDDLPRLTSALLAANELQDAFVYWQVTRGAPSAGDPVRQRVPTAMRPTVFGYATPLASVESCVEPTSRRVAVLADPRWRRGHIKATSLLGGVLAAIEADERGYDDAIFVQDGSVAESTSANVILSLAGSLCTPSLDSTSILAGVTRSLLLRADPAIQERTVSEAELRDADEVMLVGTITMVASVTHLDGRPVGRGGWAGAPGPAARTLLGTLRSAIERDRSSDRPTAPAAGMRPVSASP